MSIGQKMVDRLRRFAESLSTDTSKGVPVDPDCVQVRVVDGQPTHIEFPINTVRLESKRAMRLRNGTPAYWPGRTDTEN